MTFLAGLLLGIGIGVVISALVAVWIGCLIYDRQPHLVEDWQVLKAQREQNYHLN